MNYSSQQYLAFGVFFIKVITQIVPSQ
jgi:hypothetical protein